MEHQKQYEDINSVLLTARVTQRCTSRGRDSDSSDTKSIEVQEAPRFKAWVPRVQVPMKPRLEAYMSATGGSIALQAHKP